METEKDLKDEKKKKDYNPKLEKLTDKKLQAEWYAAQSILGELLTNNFSYEGWEKNKDSGLLRGRISWKIWKRYFIKNRDNVLCQLKDSNEYKDVDGDVKQIKETLQYQNVGEKENVKLELDGGGRNMSNLCEDAASLIKDKEILFLRPHTRKIVEVGDIKLQSNGETLFTGFIEMNDKRFVTLVEDYSSVGIWIKTEMGIQYKIKSLTPGKASIILNSKIFEKSLPQIQRVFSCPMPIMYKGKLTLPKNGYDERFSSWKNKDSIKMPEPEMELNKAKEIIERIYSEFCFSKEQDKINAIAGLLTPFLRGIFRDFNTITPFFFYLGNREGVGKDYCAAIPGLVIDGSFQQDTPICDGGKPDGDELRKKITSAIRYGRKRMHFANNKGYLNSAILEKLITDPMWVDRVLGQTEEVSSPNELDLSGSGNIPIRYSDDLKRRTIFINLFYSQEDINARQFKKSNLHKWILENRGLILSALYSLVRNWINNDMPNGSVSFSSFEQWANICGGIMETSGLGSPCVRDESNSLLARDTENDEMKELCSLCYEKYPNKPINKSNIIEIINQQEGLFSYFDFDRRADQTKFSIKLRSKLDREFGNIIMSIVNPTERTARQRFVFKKVGNLGNDGNLSLTPYVERENYIDGQKRYQTLPRLPKRKETITKEINKSIKGKER